MRVDGMVDGQFEPVREAFAETVGGSGAAVAVWLDGRWVVDLWDWDRDSIVMPYSVSKPFAAMAALTLVDRGLLELDVPMRRYWPGFRAPATVRQVLSHQAGVVALDEPAGTEVFYDWGRLCGLLANQEPAWEPGTAHGESALFYGHLVGELVRRIDGRRVGTFLREEITGPLELDFAFGLTLAEQARAVDLTGFDTVQSTEGRPELYARAIANPPGARDPRVINSTAWRAAEIPAINGHGTARAVAGLYAALRQGKSLSPGLLAEATTAQCQGIDRVFGQETAWGLGFAVYPGGFGMGGLGGNFGGTSDGYAIGFVTATLGDHTRVDRIENAFRACLGLAPL
jgi:CubicO group peptidase (beta-lactamase class C family)